MEIALQSQLSDINYLMNNKKLAAICSLVATQSVQQINSSLCVYFIPSSLEKDKNKPRVIIIICLCPFKLLRKLTDFYETWYELNFFCVDSCFLFKYRSQTRRLLVITLKFYTLFVWKATKIGWRHRLVWRKDMQLAWWARLGDPVLLLVHVGGHTGKCEYTRTFIRRSSNTISCTCSVIYGVVALPGRPTRGSSSWLLRPRLNSAAHFLIVENEGEKSP
jgi:hypothetical protein